MRHSFSTWARRSLLFAVAASLGPVALAWAYDEAHLQVFVVVPPTLATETELRIGRIELVGRVETHAVGVSRAVLRTRELRGRQVLLFDTALAPDVIDSMRIVWSGASVRVDQASIDPGLGGRTTSLALGRRLERGEAAVYLLRWEPDSTDPAAANWAPELRLEEPLAPPVAASLLLSQEDSGTIAIIDRRSHVVVGAIGTGGRPRGVAWSAAQQRLFAALGQSDEIAVIDPGRSRVVRHVPLDFGADPTRVLLSADGSRLFVLCPGRDALVVLSTASLQEIGRVLLTPGAVALAEQPRTGLVFVSTTRAPRIEVIDPDRLTILGRIERDQVPGELAFLDEGDGLVVAARDGRNLEVIDPATGVSRIDMALCGPVRGLVHQPRTSRLYAVLDLCLEVAVLRVAPALELSSSLLPSRGGLPSIDPEDRTLYVPLVHASSVLVISTTRAIEALRIETAAGPYQMVIP